MTPFLSEGRLENRGAISQDVGPSAIPGCTASATTTSVPFPRTRRFSELIGPSPTSLGYDSCLPFKRCCVVSEEDLQHPLSINSRFQTYRLGLDSFPVLEEVLRVQGVCHHRN